MKLATLHIPMLFLATAAEAVAPPAPSEPAEANSIVLGDPSSVQRQMLQTDTANQSYQIIDQRHEWVSHTGHCGITKSGQGDCTQGATGSWVASRHHITSAEQCAQLCVDRCAQCNYVSFAPRIDRLGNINKQGDDCSWYHACPLPLQQSFKGAGHVTLQVRAVPPSPPIARRLPPKGSTPGYCSLMGPTEGDCGTDDQGSFAVSEPEECLRRCSLCQRCRYVSVSLAEDYGDDNATRWGHPPHWWSCRWWFECDMDDLRRSPPLHAGYATLRADRLIGMSVSPLSVSPAVEAAPALGGSTGKRLGRLPRLAVTTLVEVDSGSGSGSSWQLACALVQWCQNARRLKALLVDRYEVRLVVLTTMDPVAAVPASDDGSGHCQGLEVVRVAPPLAKAAARCGAGRPLGFTLNKFAAFGLLDYDVVLFADLDLELLPLSEYDERKAGPMWQRGIGRFLRDKRVSLLSVPDVSSPFNAGQWLARPDAELFERGIDVLRRCQFNETHGWDLLGMRAARQAPVLKVGRNHGRNVHSSTLQAGNSLIRGHLRNGWRFVCANADQGFIFAVLFIMEKRGAAARWRKPLL